jgi:succinoglycan biosynthesis protein ExoM
VEHNLKTIDIAMCTFRRESVIDALNSLQQLELSNDWKVNIIVADNDIEPSARERVLSINAQNIPIEYIHAPKQNISIARNACLDKATADWVAFIDDDEIADKYWLINLMSKAESTGADVVLGRVDASFIHPPYPKWVMKGDFYNTRPVIKSGEIVTGYTCNVLLNNRNMHIASNRFELSLGKTGGEDTEFFHRLHDLGVQIVYAEEALVIEPVLPQRANLTWLRNRRFRAGQTHAALVLKNGSTYSKRASLMAVALIKASYCILSACASFLKPDKWRANFLRGVLHLGVCYRALGGQEIVLYGSSEQLEKGDSHNG